MPFLIHHFLERSADRFADKQALVHGKTRQSYGEIEKNANKIARGLIKKGLEKGERVALLLRNSPEYVALYYGILKSGGVVVPINTGIETEEVTNIVSDAAPRFFITEKHFLETVAVLLNNPKTPIKETLLSDVDEPAEEFSGPCSTLSALYRDNASNRVDLPIIDMDLSSIIYTSGSTGKPKGVMLTHRNIVCNTRSILAYLKLTSDDRCMVVLPFYYVYGKTLLNLHFFVGGSIVIDNRFTFPNAVLKTMISEKVTGFAGVPSTFSILFNKSSIRKMDFPDLRYLTQAGGHMPTETKTALLERFPNKQIFVMYGATEASARLSYLPPDLLREKIASIGVPIPNVAMKVVKPDGTEAPIGVEGEIVARGSNIMSGYWKNPEETQSALKAGWYHTGDLGHRDKDGYFFVTGRKKELIKTGIHKVSPKEIEEILYRHPDIFEAAVIGKPDETLGEAIKACIVLHKNASARTEEIIAHCETYLPLYKIPQEIELMQTLPKNESGKILKQKLIQ